MDMKNDMDEESQRHREHRGISGRRFQDESEVVQFPVVVFNSFFSSVSTVPLWFKSWN
jgi:hypothetical protein